VVEGCSGLVCMCSYRLYVVSTAFTAMLSGVALDAFLAGLATLQTLAFFWVNRDDPFGHKCAVGFLWLLTLFEVICNVFSVNSFAIGKGLTVLPWSFRIQVFVVSVVGVVTKMLYVLRVWKLLSTSYKRIIPIFLVLMLAVEFAFGMFAGVEVYTIYFLPNLAHMPFKWAACIAMATCAFNDVLIAITLVYAFATGNTNLTWTQSSVTMFSAYVLNTGIVTAMFSIFALVTYALDNTSPVFFVAITLLPQVYTNCFLAMMNARFYFQSATKLPRVFLPTTVEVPTMPYYPHRPSRISTNSSNHHLNPAQPQTINEVGFPLFARQSQQNDREDVSPTTPMPLEVLVQTRKEFSVGKYR